MEVIAFLNDSKNKRRDDIKNQKEEISDNNFNDQLKDFNGSKNSYENTLDNGDTNKNS